MLPLLAASAAIPTYIHVLAALFVAVTVFMILVILIQRPKGGGLSAAFGGGAGSGSAQSLIGGAGIGNALTTTTIVAFVLFLGLAMGLIWAARASHKVFQRPRRMGVGIGFEAAPVDRALLEKLDALCEAAGYFGVFESEFIESDGRLLGVHELDARAGARMELPAPADSLEGLFLRLTGAAPP